MIKKWLSEWVYEKEIQLHDFGQKKKKKKGKGQIHVENFSI